MAIFFYNKSHSTTMSHIHQIVLDFFTNTFTEPIAFEVGFCVGLYVSIIICYYEDATFAGWTLGTLILSIVMGLLMPALRNSLVLLFTRELPPIAQKVIITMLLETITITIVNLFRATKTQQKTRAVESDAK